MRQQNFEIAQRVVKEAVFILNNKSTIRECAKYFKLSKSSVHLDLSKRLKKVDLRLYESVKKLLDFNFKNKHIKGGLQTRKKYLKKQIKTV